MEKMTRIDRTLKYEGSVVSFYEDLMESPSGHQAKWDYIEHRRCGAAVLPVLDDGRIVMVRQYRNALDRETLEIPAGARDEDREQTRRIAARELEEETGYRPGKVEKLVTVANEVAFFNELVEVYLATELTRTKQVLDEDEFIEIEIYTLQELLDMVFAQKIQDCKTVAAILAYYAKIK